MADAFHLLLGLPSLLSFGARGMTPKTLCFLTSVLAILLSAEPYRSVLPWAIGMTIATVGLIERFRRTPA